MNYSITVRFIRPQNAGDDVIKIAADDDSNFHMTLRFVNTNGSKPSIKTAVMDADDLLCWFRKTFRLMDADYDPFEFYQFDFPMMPSALIHHRELHHHYETIMDAVEFNLDNWFNDTVDSDSESEPKQTNRHQFFDSNGENYTVRHNLTTDEYEMWTDSESSVSSLEEEHYAKRRNKHSKRCHHTG